MTTDSAKREEDDPGRQSGGGELVPNPAPVPRPPESKSPYPPWMPPESATPGRRSFGLTQMRGLQSIVEGNKPDWPLRAVAWITGTLIINVVGATTAGMLLGKISPQVFIIMLSAILGATLVGGVVVTWLWLRRPKPRARKAAPRKES